MSQPTDRELIEFLYRSVVEQLRAPNLPPEAIAAWAFQWDDPAAALGKLTGVLIGLHSKDIVRKQRSLKRAIRFAETMRLGASVFGGDAE